MRIVSGEGRGHAKRPELRIFAERKKPLIQDNIMGGNAIWRWTDESKVGEPLRSLSAGDCLELEANDMDCFKWEKVGLWNMELEVCYAI